MSIPPITGLGGNIPPCPQGYQYNAATGLCDPIPAAPVDMNDPAIKKLVYGLAATETDVSQAVKVGMTGLRASGFVEYVIVTVLVSLVRLLGPLIELAASLVDDFLVVLGTAFQAAQGQHTHGYYTLAGTLMTDLTGIRVDGEKLYQTFSTGGRLAAMTTLGADIFNVLSAEFAGVAQTDAGGEFNIAPGTGIAGLPDIHLTPAQGVKGAQAFLGFMTAFAIREGNTDMLAEYLPKGVGLIFKDFAEDFSKNLGLGRMGRVLLRPLLQIMVAEPLKWAMNAQYRPTLLAPGEAFRAWVQGIGTAADLDTTLSYHGYTEDGKATLKWEHLLKPSPIELRDGHLTGAIADADYAVWMHRHGYTDEVIAVIDATADRAPARRTTLKVAEHYAEQLLLGKITSVEYQQAINALAKPPVGQSMLSEGEVLALLSLQGQAVAGTRRHLSVALLNHMYIDGLITLGEFEQRVTDLGYDPDAIRELTQELLVLAKRAADKAAAAAAKAAAAAAKQAAAGPLPVPQVPPTTP